MQIGELARLTGVSTKTVRYYESIGLLPTPSRAPNDYRSYGDGDVDRLSFIRDAQTAGLTLAEIGSVLELRGRGEPTCHHVVALLQQHLDDLNRRITSLESARDELARLTARARGLDPADCTDAIRCQTIDALPQRLGGRRLSDRA